MDYIYSHSLNTSSLRQFQNRLVEKGIAGNDLAVYHEGRLVYRYMTGYRNVEERLPITQNTLYRMFSMTKPITAAVAMQLWEEGAFQLEEPISMRMPAFSHMQISSALPDGKQVLTPSAKQIRVIDLLTMTAGFGYDTETPELTAVYNRTAMRHTTQDIATAISMQPLFFTPSTRWKYSLAYDVLAAYLEVVSGLSFETLLKKRIFDPLSLLSAGYHHNEDENPLLCHAYRLDLSPKRMRHAGGLHKMLQSPRFEGGGAGLVMTVDDYAKFACALTNYGLSVDNVRILQKNTVMLMTENHLHGLPLKDFEKTLLGSAGYGYGFSVRTYIDPELAHSPAGKGSFDWGGALGTYVLMDPSHQLTVIFAQQKPGYWDMNMLFNLQNEVYASLLGFAF